MKKSQNKEQLIERAMENPPSSEVLNSNSFNDVILKRIQELGISRSALSKIVFGNDSNLYLEMSGRHTPKESSLKRLGEAINIPRDVFANCLRNEGRNVLGHPTERGTEEYDEMLNFLGNQINILNQNQEGKNYRFSSYVVDALLSGTADEGRFIGKFMKDKENRRKVYNELISLNPEKFGSIGFQNRSPERNGENEGEIGRKVIKKLSRGSLPPYEEEHNKLDKEIEKKRQKLEQEYLNEGKKVLQYTEEKVSTIAKENLGGLEKSALSNSAEDNIEMVRKNEKVDDIYRQADAKISKLKERYEKGMKFIDSIQERRKEPREDSITSVRSEIPQEIKDKVSEDTLKKLESRQGISNPVEYLKETDPEAYRLILFHPSYISSLTQSTRTNGEGRDEKYESKRRQSKIEDAEIAFSELDNPSRETYTKRDVFEDLITRPDSNEAVYDSKKGLLRVGLGQDNYRNVCVHLSPETAEEYEPIFTKGRISENELNNSEHLYLKNDE